MVPENMIVRIGHSGPLRHRPAGFRMLPVMLGLLSFTSCSPGAAADPLRPPLTDMGNIQLPKEPDKPAFDLLTLDSRSGRLYVPHSSVDTLEIVDVKARKVAGRVANLGGIKGVALTKDQNVVYTSNGHGDVTIIDVAALKSTKSIPIGGSPDAIIYDPLHDLILVAVGGLNQVMVIDPKTQAILGKIPLPGEPELMDVDQKSGAVYLAIHDLNQVVILDPVSRSITKTFKGCDIKSPTGVAYDPEQGLLFVSSSPQLNVIDLVLEQCRGGIDIGGGADQIAFNPHTHHIYTANGGSRNVSVIDTVTLKPLGVAGSGPEAATMAVDPTTDLVYVMVARAGIVAVYHDP